jgi:hypothetical protein
MQTKASSSKSSAKANKFSMLSSLAIASKGRHLRKQEHKTQPKGPTKQRETAKVEIGAKTKNRVNASSAISSMEKTRGMSPGIAQTLKRHRRESKAEQTPSLRINKHQGR